MKKHMRMYIEFTVISSFTEMISERRICNTLEFGSEEAVRRLAGNCIKCGSDIVSPACGLGMSSPLRNIQALLSSVEESDG